MLTELCSRRGIGADHAGGGLAPSASGRGSVSAGGALVAGGKRGFVAKVEISDDAARELEVGPMGRWGVGVGCGRVHNGKGLVHCQKGRVARQGCSLGSSIAIKLIHSVSFSCQSSSGSQLPVVGPLCCDAFFMAAWLTVPTTSVLWAAGVAAHPPT